MNLCRPGDATRPAHAVLAPVSRGCPPAGGWLHTRYAPVRHCRRHCCQRPFDLHVLGLPLAFILSQDQTLHCMCLLRRAARRRRAFLARLPRRAPFCFHPFKEPPPRPVPEVCCGCPLPSAFFCFSRFSALSRFPSEQPFSEPGCKGNQCFASCKYYGKKTLPLFVFLSGLTPLLNRVAKVSEVS